MSLLKTIIYKTSTGKEPFTDWLLDQEKTTRAIIFTLSNFGDCKTLKQASSVWELRIDYGPGYRIYFGKEGQTMVVLLIGGNKGSQERDIVKAQRYWLDYKGNKDDSKKKSS